MSKKKLIPLISLVAVLVLSIGIAPASAYFTDSSTTNGGLPIHVKPTTEIREWNKDGVKHVIISNSDDADGPVFVRARVYSALDYSETAGDGWVKSGDWYYYGTPDDQGKPDNNLTALLSGESANELIVKVKFPERRQQTEPEGFDIDDNRNVVVVYESTPAIYDTDENGVTRSVADWSFTLDNGTSEGGE